MTQPLPNNLASWALTDNDFEEAFTASNKDERTPIKNCLALLHRFHNEAPSMHTSTMTWPDAGFCLEHTKKTVPWAIIHCPHTTNATHLAAAIVITRLACVPTCLVIFDKKPIPPSLLTSLELCGISAEYSLVMNDINACELLLHMAQYGHGRLVLLGNASKAIATTALQQSIPIIHASNTKNFTTDANLQGLQICPNLTPAMFMEHSLHAKHITEAGES